jgi:hypothetical protein
MSIQEKKKNMLNVNLPSRWAYGRFSK